jgi:hypothetical protein
MLRATAAVVLGSAGAAGLIVVLTGQGLDRAEKWVSLVGVILSLAVGVAGLLLAWLTWRQGPGQGPAARISRTGDATASGRGSVAVSGSLGEPSATVDRTGAAWADQGGRAVTGMDRSAEKPR